MPTSQPYQLNEILWLIIETEPKSILDIGVGFGKYGFLSREYLELYDGREVYNDWKVRIEGIEAFSQFLTPVHEFIYDKIYIGNAIDILPSLKNNFDLVLIIDVLEHFSYEDGMELLRVCHTTANNILISIPKKVSYQLNSFNNPFETHKFQFNKAHFNNFKDLCCIPNNYSLILYIGENAPKFRRAVFHNRVKKYFPFLKYPYRAIQKYLYLF